MKNFKSFLIGFICCLCVVILQSSNSNGKVNEGDFRVSLKYFHRDKTNQYYTLIITETTDHMQGISIHTQLEPGILKSYNK